jgi:hypothetical protein
MYELAGDAKPVLKAIYRLRDEINRLNGEGILYWQNVERLFEDTEAYLKSFLERHPNFPYRDGVIRLFQQIRDEVYEADTTSPRRVGNYTIQPTNVRASRLPKNSMVFLNLYDLAGLVIEGYHKQNSQPSKVLSIAALTISSLFLIYTFSQTSTANVSLPAFKTTSIFLSLFLLLLSSFLLLRHKLKKH